jgi:hypothetical protein
LKQFPAFNTLKFKEMKHPHNAMKYAIILLFSLIPPLSILAQKATGLLEDDDGYARQTMMAQYTGAKNKDLPKSVSLKSYCPLPGNQGVMQACVGWSIGYGALTIERAIQNDWADAKMVTQEAFSALFIYNQIKGEGSCDKALSSMSVAMDFVKNKGNCLDKEFNVSDCQKKPDAKLLENAKKYTAKAINSLFPKDAQADVKINALRSILAKKKPVVISLRINNQFKALKNVKTWYPETGDIPTECHAITVIGYDDDIGCFQLLNSWGRDWANKGFINIKYADLAQYCPYAYVIYLYKNEKEAEPLVIGETKTEKIPPSQKETTGQKESTGTVKPDISSKSTNKPPIKVLEKPDVSSKSPTVPPKKVPEKPEKAEKPTKPAPSENTMVDLAGQFVFNEYKGQTNRGDYIFQPAEVERIDNHYTLKKKDWKVGDQFQLALTSDFSEVYVYVISLNPKNEVNVIYPRNEDYNKKFTGLHESPLIMLDGARVVLPNPQQVMRIQYTGTDRLCIFFSLKEIKNLPKVGDLLKNRVGDFEKYVHNLLGENMIPLTDTAFEEDKIAFSTMTRSKGAIVPIIVEFQAK